MVEHRLAKARVASSNLVSRFRKVSFMDTFFICTLISRQLPVLHVAEMILTFIVARRPLFLQTVIGLLFYF